MRRPKVYVSGPFTGANELQEQTHINIACTIGARLWEIGFAALTPHTNCNMTTAESEKRNVPYEAWMEFDLDILVYFDCIFMCPGWEDSPGSNREWWLAKAMKIPIFYNFEQAQRWLDQRR